MDITLDKLPFKKNGIIKELNVKDDLKVRLLDLGFINNSKIKKLYKSPFNDPCAYLIMGSVIAIRNEDAKNIIVYYREDECYGIN